MTYGDELNVTRFESTFDCAHLGLNGSGLAIHGLGTDLIDLLLRLGGVLIHLHAWRIDEWPRGREGGCQQLSCDEGGTERRGGREHFIEAVKGMQCSCVNQPAGPGGRMSELSGGVQR